MLKAQHALTSLLVCFALAACSGAEDPSRTWEVAAQGVFTGALSTEADLVIVGSMNHGASLWKTPENERLYNWSHAQGEFAELVAASFSPDGSRAVTSDPSSLVLWNTATGEALEYWGTPGSVLDVALLADNRHALLGLDNHTALLFDAASGAYQQTLRHEGEVGAVAISQDGKFALTGSDDYSAVYWDLNSGEIVHTYRHDNPVREVALSPTGKLAFTAAQGDLVAIWDNTRGIQLHELHNGINHGVVSARFSDDERYLVIGYANRQVTLVDVSTGQVLRRWDPGLRHAMRRGGAAVVEVAFKANSGAVLALTGDGRLLEFRLS